MKVPYDSTLTDPSLKQIVQYFFGHACYDEYSEYRLIRNSADPTKPFESGPTLVRNRQVFLLLIKPGSLVMTTITKNVRTAFPEFSEHKLIPIFMSTVIQPDQVKYLTKQGIYAMALGEEAIELLNFDELQGR